MKKHEKLIVNISLESRVKPEMERSPSKLLRTLESIINAAIQCRFPEFDVEIGKLEGNWPNSDKEFPTVDQSKY